MSYIISYKEKSCDSYSVAGQVNDFNDIRKVVFMILWRSDDVSDIHIEETSEILPFRLFFNH